VTPPTEPEVADASDAVELADEIAARFRTLQRHEEAVYVARSEYDDNLAELRALIDAIHGYAIVPHVAPNAW